MQCMLQNILKEVIFWALLASGDFHKNEVQCPRKALLGDAWSEILAGLSELGLTVLTSLWRKRLTISLAMTLFLLLSPGLILGIKNIFTSR